jgi:hypothetical protein
MKWIILGGTAIGIILSVALCLVVSKKLKRIKNIKKQTKSEVEIKGEHTVYQKVLSEIYEDYQPSTKVGKALMTIGGLGASLKKKTGDNLSSMRTQAEEDEKTNELCPLCSKNFKNCRKKPKLLPGTDKLYHADCLAIWVRRNRKCPSTLHVLVEAVQVVKRISKTRLTSMEEGVGDQSVPVRRELKNTSIQPKKFLRDEDSILNQKRKEVKIKKGSGRRKKDLDVFLARNVIQEQEPEGLSSQPQTRGSSPVNNKRKVLSPGKVSSRFNQSPNNIRRMNSIKNMQTPLRFSNLAQSNLNSPDHSHADLLNRGRAEDPVFDFGIQPQLMNAASKKKAFKQKRTKTYGNLGDENKGKRKKKAKGKKKFERSQSIGKYQVGSYEDLEIQRFASPDNYQNHEFELGEGFSIKPKSLFQTPKKGGEERERDDSSVSIDEVSDMSSENVKTKKFKKKLLIDESSSSDDFDLGGL